MLVIFYHISPSRSKLVAEAMLEFDGIVGSDSYSAWNDVGSNHQKCLLRYFRDLYRTLDKNHADEFKAPFDETHGILNGAIDPMQNKPNHWCVQLKGADIAESQKTTPLRLRCRPLGNPYGRPWIPVDRQEWPVPRRRISHRGTIMHNGRAKRA